ncbi:hypothetical protein BD309DRAFT_233889 [Dichomitus squalens]|nr:hypothetical protein BD309DRAFT_233889 [Dichomitus squalens]
MQSGGRAIPTNHRWAGSGSGVFLWLGVVAVETLCSRTSSHYCILLYAVVWLHGVIQLRSGIIEYSRRILDAIGSQWDQPETAHESAGRRYDPAAKRETTACDA